MPRLPASLVAVMASALLLAACGATIPGITTSAVKAPVNDATARALQVGSTSARAIKCGFNIDPAKLRMQFLAAEAAAAPTEADKLGRIYDTAFNGVSKAISPQGEGYCSEAKVATIKEALNRHLAGDYNPPPAAPVEDEGLFGSLDTKTEGDSDYAKKMQANPTLQH